MRTKIKLADPFENYSQGFRPVLPSGPRVALDGDPTSDDLPFSDVSP